MICGPFRPVSGLCSTTASPDSTILRSSSRTTLAPSVCPGACTARGRPGTSIVSPSPNVETSAIGTIFAPPRRDNEMSVR